MTMIKSAAIITSSPQGKLKFVVRWDKSPRGEYAQKYVLEFDTSLDDAHKKFSAALPNTNTIMGRIITKYGYVGGFHLSISFHTPNGKNEFNYADDVNSLTEVKSFVDDVVGRILV